MLAAEYEGYTFEFAAAESGIDAAVLREVAEVVAGAGSRLSTHNWRSAGAGNEGGWQVARTLFLLNALLGAVATPGGTYPNAWNKFVPRPIRLPRHPEHWNELTWPAEYPLAMNELSFLLPHLIREGRGKLDVYFTRVYNPVWTNPDGFSWIEMLTDEAKVGLHAALTPTWNETAYFADYVLPMGGGSERHDLHSYETHDGQWIAFRQPVLRAARERLGETVTDTRQVNPGEVWEENEFWLELSWRIDPDGALGIRPFVESAERPGERLSVDEYYRYIFERSVPGLPEKAAAEGLKPLEYMRRYGAFEVAAGDRAGARAGGAGGRAGGRGDRPLRPGLHPGGGAAGGEPRAHRRSGGGRRGAPAGGGGGRRPGAARVPHPERPAGVLLLDPGRAGAGRRWRSPPTSRATSTPTGSARIGWC